MERAGYVHLRRTERGFLVETADGDAEAASAPPTVAPVSPPEVTEEPAASEPAPETAAPSTPETRASAAAALEHLKQAMAEATAKAPTKPLYLRQISQMLRTAGQDYDSRRHGFRGILDLLHQAQREGWLRLHRDRKGVWRVFSATPSAVGSGPVPVLTAEPVLAVGSAPVEAESDSAEVDVAWETPTPVEEIPVEEVPLADQPSPSVIEETAGVEAPPAERKPRKPRAAKGTKTGARKTSSRRKAKEKVTSDE